MVRYTESVGRTVLVNPIRYGTCAYPNHFTFALLDVIVRVSKRDCGSAVPELDGDVGKISPIRSRRQRDEVHPGFDEGRHLLAHVVAQAPFRSATNQALELIRGNNFELWSIKI